MKAHRGCQCHPASPFLWRQQNTPSICMADRSMQPAKTSGLSKSERATNVIEKQKAAGKITSTIHGISRDREAELLRLREFMSYSRAKRSDVAGVEVMENGNVAA